MSLTIPTPGAAASIPSTAGKARKDQADPSGPGSFGEALSRATRPVRESTEKPGDKTVTGTPGRRHGGGLAAEADEKRELVNTLWSIPVESRTRSALLPAKAEADPDTLGTRAASATSAAGQTAAGALLQPQVETLSPDAPTALPDAATDARAATGLALAGAVQEETGPASALAKEFPVSRLVPVPDALPAAGSTTVPSPATDGPAFTPALATDQVKLDAKEAGDAGDNGDNGDAGDGNSPEMRPAAPTASAAMVKQALNTPASDVESSNTATVAAPSQPAPTGDATNFTGLALTNAAPQGVAISAGAAPPPSITVLAVRPEVGSSEWGQALSQQLVHLGRAGQETAELQLNPPGLGPLKVSLNMNDQQIQATFVSAHSSVRAAVEAALPQLRAALADNGISLGDTSVSSDSRQQADADQSQGSRPRSHSEADAIEARAPMAERSRVEPRQQRGGASVDTYA